MKNRNSSERIIDLALVIIAAVICILIIYPVIYILSVSLSSNAEISRNNILFFPRGLTFAAYSFILNKESIQRGIVNSVIYTSTGTLLNLLLTSSLAYALSRKRLVGKKIMMYMVIIPLFFSGGMIPTYMVVYKLHMKDTIFAIILPWAILSFYLILFKAFFEDIPDEMIESASIDGANDFMIFIRIILPMSTTIVASVGLFYAIDNWNNFTNALLYIYTPEKYPLSFVLRNLLVAPGETAQNMNDRNFVVLEAQQDATIILSMIPIGILYPVLQRYFTKGVMLGAIKG